MQDIINVMRRFFENGVLLRLILLMIIISILGLSPNFHQVDDEMRGAQISLSSGTPEAASRKIASAASYLPWRNDLWELAGRLALQGGDPQTAIVHLERALVVSYKNGIYWQKGISPQGLIDLGDAYQQIGDLSSAIRSWGPLVSQGGYSEELTERLVQAYVSQEDYLSAISILQGQIDLEPENAQLYYQLGLFTSTQNPDEALASLENAAQLDPSLGTQVSELRRGILSARYAEDFAYSLLVTGRTLASLDEWQLATEAFRQSTLSRPDYAEAWAYLGEALQTLYYQTSISDSSKENSDDGFYELQKALELDPKSLSAHIFMSLYWKRQKNYDLALELTQSAIDINASNPIIHVELANLLAASGDLNGAFNAHLKAISLAPHDSAYQEYLIMFALEYDYHIEEIALSAARQIVIQSPNDAAALDLMAQVLIRQGDLLTAERFLRRALGEDTYYASAHLHLGLVFILLENYRDAYHELTLAANLVPDSDIANQAQRLLVTYFP